MRSRCPAAAALALLTVAGAGCASAPAPAPSPPQAPSGGYASLGLSDVPVATRPLAPKTLNRSESCGGASFLAQLAAGWLNWRY